MNENISRILKSNSDISTALPQQQSKIVHISLFLMVMEIIRIAKI